MKKEYIEANALVRDSLALAKDVFDSEFRPDFLLVLWRGGTPVGVVVHEFLLFNGVETYHTVVKAESYEGVERRKDPEVEHLDYVVSMLTEDSRVLVVDDIFDTGCTLKKVVEALEKKTKSIRTATLYYKTGKNMTDITPDFFVRKTDCWIVFPHELMDLSLEEIKEKDEFVHKLLTS